MPRTAFMQGQEDAPHSLHEGAGGCPAQPSCRGKGMPRTAFMQGRGMPRTVFMHAQGINSCTGAGAADGPKAISRSSGAPENDAWPADKVVVSSIC